MREAALMRLRPVLMTSVATVAGHFPLTLVTGAGAAARNSIGIMIVAGMALGTMFTLLVIPCDLRFDRPGTRRGKSGGRAGQLILPDDAIIPPRPFWTAPGSLPGETQRRLERPLAHFP